MAARHDQQKKQMSPAGRPWELLWAQQAATSCMSSCASTASSSFSLLCLASPQLAALPGLAFWYPCGGLCRRSFASTGRPGAHSRTTRPQTWTWAPGRGTSELPWPPSWPTSPSVRPSRHAAGLPDTSRVCSCCTRGGSASSSPAAAGLVSRPGRGPLHGHITLRAPKLMAQQSSLQPTSAQQLLAATRSMCSDGG